MLPNRHLLNLLSLCTVALVANLAFKDFFKIFVFLQATRVVSMATFKLNVTTCISYHLSTLVAISQMIFVAPVFNN